MLFVEGSSCLLFSFNQAKSDTRWKCSSSFIIELPACSCLPPVPPQHGKASFLRGHSLSCSHIVWYLSTLLGKSSLRTHVYRKHLDLGPDSLLHLVLGLSPKLLPSSSYKNLSLPLSCFSVLFALPTPLLFSLQSMDSPP